VYILLSLNYSQTTNNNSRNKGYT